MKSYMQYVHNMPGNSGFWSLWNRKSKSEEAYKVRIGSKNDLQKAILKESDQKILDYVSTHLDLEKSYKNIIFSSREKSYVENVDFNNVKAIINFRLINEIKHVNHHFRSVNKLLPDKGIYIGRVETYWERKIRIFNKYGKKIGQIVWLADFCINRIIPKLRPLTGLYKFFNRNTIYPKSQAEILGRLVYCGFQILEFDVIDNLFYFVVRKKQEPRQDNDPTFHALVKLKRIGKNGKMINVYKLRTMHPYSEYLQDYVLKLYGYNEVGKPAYDFRVARWGRIFRKFWIDEIPQFINVLKGELKLVGVRPLSVVRFNEFPKDMQEERIKHKPGCFPPYVALCMPDEEGNIEAERIYLKDLAKHPYTTDIKYLMVSIYNILTNKIRSS
jgi:hypothetical protein